MPRAGAIVGAILAIAMSSVTAKAGPWPEKPVRLVVLSSPGGSPDVAARAISERLSRTLGQRFIVENKVSAGGITGWSALKESAPDGYTFALVAASAYLLTPHLFKNLPFDMAKDFVPAAYVGAAPIVVAVKKDSPYRSFADLIKASRADDGKAAVGTTAINSLPHLLIELANSRAEAKFNVVPFSSSPTAITAVLGGDVRAMADGYPSFVGMLTSGEMRVLATFSPERIPNNRSIPTVSETIPGLAGSGWFAVFAPKGTPDDVIEKFRTSVNDAIGADDVTRQLLSLSIFPESMDGEELAKFLKKEQLFWMDAVKTVASAPN
jgi:tripartite-type tricarboxylate transporter receptor subunit TctC